MSVACVHVFVSGSKIAVLGIAVWGPSTWPPMARTRPSASTTCAAQWKFMPGIGNGAGTGVIWPVAGSQTRASSLVRQ